MNNPLVSAIITTHNRKNLLEKAICSIYAQSYLNIEIIVVDDASTDGSKSCITAKYPNVLYLYNNKVKGANFCRNIGIINAKGEYVALLDDDDEWLCTKIEKQVKFLESNKDYGLVSCSRKMAFDNGYEYTIPKQEFPSSGDISQSIWHTLSLVSSTFLIKKKTLKLSGLFDENIIYWQDYEFLLRYSQHFKIGIILEPLVYYRASNKDTNRKSNNIIAWEKSIIYIHKKHCTSYKALPNDVKLKHKYIVAQDGLRRSISSHNNIKKLKYQFKLLRFDSSFRLIKSTFKTFIKIILRINE